MGTPRSRSFLKVLWITLFKPTQLNYEDMHASFFNLTDDTIEDINTTSTNTSHVFSPDGAGGITTRAEAADSDDKVKISATDTTAAYLDDKINVGDEFTKETENPAANEDLLIKFKGWIYNAGRTFKAILSFTGTADRTYTLLNESGTIPLLESDSTAFTGNITAPNINGLMSTETAAGTTTLTVASTYEQVLTGATTQTIVMPVVSTLVLGREFKIINNSTGILTVQSSGTDEITTISAGITKILTCIKITGTDETSWTVNDFGIGAAFPSITDNGTTVQVDANLVVTGQAHGGYFIKEWSASATFNANDGNNQGMLCTANSTIEIENELQGTFIIHLVISGASVTALALGTSLGTPYDNNAELIYSDGDKNTITVYVDPWGNKQYTINTITA
jgi:hypothetical protein